MKKLFILAAMVLPFGASYGQQYFSRTGMVSFFASTPLEDIKADNNQVYVVIDLEKKQLAFSALLKGFIFPKELMQEHFNENYVESDKYPKATFTGTFSGDVNIHKEGSYVIHVKGQLALHNVVKAVDIPATLEVKGRELVAVTQFMVKPEDFQITIPSVVRNKIAKEVTIKVNANCFVK